MVIGLGAGMPTTARGQASARWIAIAQADHSRSSRRLA
jgi:hypothetical protein